jgi:Zn-dependent metalloprotease
MTQHRHHAKSCGCCFIVPPVILRSYSRDANLDPNLRSKLQETFAETKRLKVVRDAARVALLATRTSTPSTAAARAVAAGAAVQQMLFDCQHRQSLPGRTVSDPAQSSDEAVKQVFDVTGKVADFYQEILKRNSIDNQGMDLVSSVHYRVNFDNAFFNGQQMVYGDGDGDLFIDFWRSPDVVGHELTHGVTQYESGLRYEGESGALNESISDVFGAVFNQWIRGWAIDRDEGWLIGAGIMGPRAKNGGKTCLRDMVTPGDAHCLSPQPDSYDNFDPTADVHENSGIPNKAFAVFARSVGGNAWDTAIKVWYAACIDRRLSSGATFADFGGLTMEAAETLGGRDLRSKAQAAWEAVHVPIPGV